LRLHSLKLLPLHAGLSSHNNAGNGMDDPERQKAEIVARLAEASADIPDIHPNIANLHRRRAALSERSNASGS
jgi:hypothetical protein